MAFGLSGISFKVLCGLPDSVQMFRHELVVDVEDEIVAAVLLHTSFDC